MLVVQISLVVMLVLSVVYVRIPITFMIALHLKAINQMVG